MATTRKQGTIMSDKTGGTIYKKLSMILGERSPVNKSGRNKYLDFNYIKEDDIFASIAPLLAAAGVWVTHSIDSVAIVEGTKGKLLEVHTTHTFYDSETGESYTVNWVGFGQEQDKTGVFVGDKCIGIAMTYIMKMLFGKHFMISDKTDENYGDGVGNDDSLTEETRPAKPAPVTTSKSEKPAAKPATKPAPAAEEKPTEKAESSKPQRPYAPEYVKAIITNHADKSPEEPGNRDIAALKKALTGLCGTNVKSRDAIIKYLTGCDNLSEIPTIGQVEALIKWIKLDERGMADKSTFDEAVLIIEKFGMNKDELYE